MAIGIAAITTGSFAAITSKTRSRIIGKSVSLFPRLFIGLTMRRAERTLDSFCGFDDLRKIFVFCLNSHFIHRHCHQRNNHCERFEPRSHFMRRLSVIIRVKVVMNRTVVVGD